MKKKILYTILALLVIIQFFRPEKNLSDESLFDVHQGYYIPANINLILQKACNDCHTNKTRYPWYSDIQPAAWWMANHVKEGKGHLNLSEFTKRKIAYQNHKLEEFIDEVKEKEMPLPSYTWLGLHADANLSDAERTAIMDWAQKQMDSLKRTYPPDSLVLKRRQPPPAAN